MKQVFILMFAANVWAAGFSSFQSPYIKKVPPIIVAIAIKDTSLMKDARVANLTTEISFISERGGEKKLYKSDDYQNMLTELELESEGLVVDIVVNKKEIKKDELGNLKKEIEQAVQSLILKKKKDRFGDKEVRIDMAITSIYITGVGTPVRQSNY